MMIVNHKICEKCNCLISSANFNRHFNSCKGIRFCPKCGSIISKRNKRFCSESCKVSIINSERDWFGENNAFYGKHHSELTKRKRIETMMKNGTYHASVSKSETLFFDILESLLHRKIKRQFHVDGKIFDGCIGDLLIECDSDYWHQNALKNDLLKNKIAVKNDFKLLRARINNVKEAQEKARYFSDIIEFVT